MASVVSDGSFCKSKSVCIAVIVSVYLYPGPTKKTRLESYTPLACSPSSLKPLAHATAKRSVIGL